MLDIFEKTKIKFTKDGGFGVLGMPYDERRFSFTTTSETF
jgi:hypothetical protein